MRGLTYANGYFPFCVREKNEEGDAFGEWDGTTRFGGAPSGSSSAAVTVYGQGTGFPIGLTLEEMSELYWRIKYAKYTFSGDLGSSWGSIPPTNTDGFFKPNNIPDPLPSPELKATDLVCGGFKWFEIPRPFDGDGEPTTTPSPPYIYGELAGTIYLGQSVIKVGALYYPSVSVTLNSATWYRVYTDETETEAEWMLDQIGTPYDGTAIKSETNFPVGQLLLFGKTIQLYSNNTGEDPDSFQITIEAAKFYTYGGIYDEDTGAKV